MLRYTLSVVVSSFDNVHILGAMTLLEHLVEEVLLDYGNAVVGVLGHGLDMDGLGELLVLGDGSVGGCIAMGAWLVVE